MMKNSSTKITFWLLVAVFLIILSQFLVPPIKEFLEGTTLFLLPSIIFSLLGFALIVFTLKEKPERMPKIFLLLTGASAAGFFVLVFFHNAFYALAVATNQWSLVSYSMGVLDAASFLTAIFICPIGFLVGTIGTLVLLSKKR